MYKHFKDPASIFNSTVMEIQGNKITATEIYYNETSLTAELSDKY